MSVQRITQKQCLVRVQGSRIQNFQKPILIKKILIRKLCIIVKSFNRLQKDQTALMNKLILKEEKRKAIHLKSKLGS